MIDVFFKGYGYWEYRDGLSRKSNDNAIIPLSSCTTVEGEACGVFMLSHDDEIAYRYTKSLDGIKILMISEHPDKERPMRKDIFFLKTGEPSGRENPLDELEENCLFVINKDKPMILRIVEVNKAKSISKAAKPITPVIGGSAVSNPPPIIPPADYETWCKADLWTIRRGIFLLLEVENISCGDSYSDKTLYKPLNDKFNKMWEVAESSLKTDVLKQRGKLDSLDSEVSPSDFIAWARLKGYSIPQQLELITPVMQPEPPINQDHISKDLIILNKAAYEFWSSADKDDKKTHPKNEDVEKWLVSEGFSQVNAKQGAVIIRPKWAAIGRRSE